MSLGLVTQVAIIQGYLLAAVFLILCANHWTGSFRKRRHDHHLAEATHRLSAWFDGDCGADELRDSLALLQFSSVASLLQLVSIQREGDDWEQLASTLRETDWYGAVGVRARSRLWWRRLAATRILAILASAQEEGLLVELVADPEGSVRLAASRSLSRLSSPKLVEAVLEYAAPNRAVVRRHLLETLARSGAGLVEVLEERLQSTDDVQMLRTALELTSQVADPRLLGHVLGHTAHESIEIQIAATRAIGAFPHPRSSERLQTLLEHETWQVRTQAAIGLGRIGATEANDALGRSIMDPNWWVRLRSALSLRMLGPEGMRTLREVDGYRDYYAYEMAQYVLGLEEAAVAEYVSGMLPQDAADRPVTAAGQSGRAA